MRAETLSEINSINTFGVNSVNIAYRHLIRHASDATDAELGRRQRLRQPETERPEL